MPKPKLPVVTGEQTAYPARAVCPRCGRRKVFEPHSFAVISGGALFGRLGSKNAGPDPRMKGFFGLTWHGAHDNGSGDHRDVYVRVDVAKDCEDGQFEMYFCSPKCLRAFFDDCVDELEARIANPDRGRPRGGKDPIAGLV